MKRNFRPSTYYGLNGGDKCIKLKVGGGSYHFAIFSDVITAVVCLRQLVQSQEWLQVKLSRLDKDEKTSVQEVRGDRDSSEANTAPGINSLREGRGNSQWVLEEDV